MKGDGEYRIQNLLIIRRRIHIISIEFVVNKTLCMEVGVKVREETLGVRWAVLVNLYR